MVDSPFKKFGDSLIGTGTKSPQPKPETDPTAEAPVGLQKAVDLEKSPDADAQKPAPGTPAAKKSSKKQPTKGGGMAIGKSFVDLTPKVYREAMEARETKKRWVFINGGILGVVVLLTGTLFFYNIPVKQELKNDLSNNQKLQAALAEYEGQNETLDQKEIDDGKLNLAAGSEINWSSLIGALQGMLPPGTTIVATGLNAEAVSSENGAGIFISFSSSSPLGYANTLKSVQESEGVSNARIGGLTSSEDAYLFSITLNYDPSVRTNRFPAPTGGL